MELLHFPFESEVLNSVQKNIHSVMDLRCPLLFEGARGTGKSSWAEIVLKARGNYFSLNFENAPKSSREWKNCFQFHAQTQLLLDNIDMWSEIQRNSLMIAIAKDESVRSRIVTTSGPGFQMLSPQLYFRLATRKISIPDVTECKFDFKAIVDFWLKVHCLVLGRSVPEISTEAFQKLNDADWSGGWSEFIMTLERSVSFQTTILKPEHILFDQASEEISYLQAGLTLAEMEKKLILQTLHLTSSNKTQAARILGISIRTLRNKLNEYQEGRTHELV